MPTYHPRGISVRLGTLPLDKTITPHVVLRKGEVAKQQCEDAEKQLRSSRKLEEHHVPLPGDTSGLELAWLDDVPFMQVEVDNSSDDIAAPQLSATKGIGHPDTAPTSTIPKALVLHVDLSNKSFISGFDDKTHLKIDVLFNGQLSSCSLVHTNDIRSGAKSLDQVFAGSRTDFLAERPWVILPPGTTLDGNPRGLQTPISAEERWDQIDQALLNEAIERGINKHSDLPSTAKLLVSLAKMQMPDQLRYESPGGKTFGVIDVIITAGIGKKVTSGTSYLKRPERLRDTSFAPASMTTMSEQQQFDEPEEQKRVVTNESHEPDQELTGMRDDGEEVHDSDQSDYEPATKRRFKPSIAISRNRPQPTLTLSSPFTAGRFPLLPPPVQHTPRPSPSWTLPQYGQTGECSQFSDDENFGQPMSPTHCYATSGSQYGTYANRLPPNGGLGEHRSYGSPESQLPSTHTGTCLPSYNPWHSDPIFGSRQSPEQTTFGSHNGVGSLLRPLIPALKPAYPVYPKFSPLQSPNCADPSDAFNGPLRSSELPGGNERRPSVDSVQSYFGPSTPGFPSLYRYGTSVVSSPGTIMTPSSLSNMPSYAPMSYETGSSSPLERRFTYPPHANNWGHSLLPPTGFYTVTQKPSKTTSPSNSKQKNTHSPQRSIAISRLIITGKSGAAILDHQWSSPQHLGRSGPKHKQNRKLPMTFQRTSFFDGHFLTNESNIRPLEETIITRLSHATGPLFSEAENLGMNHTDLNRRNSAPTLPYLKKHHGGSNKPSVGGEQVRAASDCSILSETSESMKVPKIFKINRTGILGVQGPKAATYLLDDPEEFLREAARLRKSRLPTKSSMEHRSMPQTPTPTTDSSDTNYHNLSPSSPLSSVPPSPGDDSIPQFDGPPERRRTTLSPLKLTQNVYSSTPKFFDSSDPKKRKYSSLSPVKRPRTMKTPDTTGNPLLNQNCVIAFAEGVDPTSKQGILRQVRGERQGVFKEDYVVLAVRFYVPGN